MSSREPVYHDYSPEELFINVLFFMAMFVLILIVFILFYFAIKRQFGLPAFMQKQALNWKILQALIRFISIAYFPITFVSLRQLIYGTDHGLITLAVILLILLTLGFPILLAFILKRRLSKKRITKTIASKNRQKLERTFHQLFDDYKFSYQWFLFIVQLKLFLYALFLTAVKEQISQSFGITIMLFIYILLLFLKPYKRAPINAMGIFMNFVNLLTVFIPILLLFVDLSSHSYTIQWILIGLQGSIILGYFLNGIYTLTRALVVILNKFGSKNSGSRLLGGRILTSVDKKNLTKLQIVQPRARGIELNILSAIDEDKNQGFDVNHLDYQVMSLQAKHGGYLSDAQSNRKTF
eukprot:c18549_g1_i2.p1 GENE.c18549_g1_i2~~c18549_g1_i2.p1  ORF type:complete len:411 (+),score=76.46 c18549_g1_i2:179-1234(+)